jgi:hypothetical protein
MVPAAFTNGSTLHVHHLTDHKHISSGHNGAGCILPATSAVTRSFQDFTSFNACFRKVAGGRLVTRDALREPNAMKGHCGRHLLRF